MKRMLLAFSTCAAGFVLLWAACNPEIQGPSGTDGGTGGGDGGSSNHDSGSSGGDGGTTFPDATAEAGGYLVSDESGNAVTESSGNMPDGDPNANCYIDPFNGNSTFIPGGTNRYSGTVVNGFADALLVEFEELAGYYEFGVSSNDFSFFVTLGQDVRATHLTLVVVARLAVSESNPQGGYCQPLRFPVTVQQVGTGDLQVSLSWETETDVDLHLIEPGGEELYWSHLTSAAGGELDLDSNPACRMDYVNNENITYQGVTPPSGHYTVRVDYWDACDEQGTTGFLVTVNIRGTPTVVEGSFQRNEMDQGGAGSGTTVYEFEF